MDNLYAAMLLLLFGVPLSNAAASSPEIPHFQSEVQAQQHCPGEAIVWLIAPPGLYNSSRERWYGRTNNGTYACLKEAEKAGYRASSAASAAR